jgi:glucuronate isomerase
MNLNSNGGTLNPSSSRKVFLDENFLLQTPTSQKLYHDFAKEMPIIDYHCHLPPEQIAGDINFENITQAWLYGDHYKWKAMRTNGVHENYCTGNKSDFEKFRKWSETVPYSLRNLLYHWTYLELERYFDVHEILNGNSAEIIYEECSARLQTPEYSVRNLLRKMNVKVVCTTDDPTDSLEHHQKIKDDACVPDRQGFEIKVLPAFRPDKAMNVDEASAFNGYLTKLEAASNVSIASFNNYLDALKSRHDFFATMGCSVSDHGVEQIAFAAV